MNTSAIALAVTVLCASSITAQESPSSRVAKIIDATGVAGGFVVHLGCGDGELTTALRRGDSYQVHGLSRSAADVEAARRRVDAAGLYGPVSIDRLRGERLPYVDNLVNLLVSGEPGVSDEEILRVLAPLGAAHLGSGDTARILRKPRPGEIDDWTHFLHSPSGNAVARDSVVGPPRHLQWIGTPRWSRHHDRMASVSAMVSAKGRVFYITDEGSRVSIQLPPRWKLIARDAFNGTILWKRDIPRWHSHLWPLKSGPTQLARRLVAIGDEVWVTLGLRAPLTALDARTGKTLRTYDGSKSTEEVLVARDAVLTLVNTGESELTSFVPKHNVGDQQRVANEFLWNEEPRAVVAFDRSTGAELWRRETRVSPLTLAEHGGRTLFHDGERIVCIATKSGDELWTSEPASRRRSFTMHFGPKLVIHDDPRGDVVLFAGGDRVMTALDAKSGERLWSSGHDRSGYQSPEDLLVTQGLVWSAPTTRTNDTGEFTGRDPRTGEVKSRFSPNVKTYWFHHRCHMAKATERFILPSRTGIEFVDPEKKQWTINHWVRGGCLYGVMPSNGLVYTPPHNCACYPEAKLYGLNALAPSSTSRAVPREVEHAGRLERGPAFSTPMSSDASSDGDWPTYRRDDARSGATKTAVSPSASAVWRQPIGGLLSAPVVAGGRVYVAAIDAHRVHALDAGSGRPVWAFTAGGRVDSPPTVRGGRAYFGCADGWVYCLRAEDGALVWRFRAAPRDERLMAFEQLESVWPVSGSVLVRDGSVFAVAGRSNFLDGGLRFVRLDAVTGAKQTESVIDDIDPETGESLQARLQVLNMTAGLPDVLSSDGRWLYMRSQRLDLAGKRQNIGPVSGSPAEQGAAQRGEGLHLFAPMGFLDGTWFHRSYWVYGRNFAGGHAGYYQAGKFAPSGRILVFDDEKVWGFGRKPKYYRWTTTLEHELFSTSKLPPAVPAQRQARRGASTAMVSVKKSPSIDPTGKAITVEAWVKPERPGGVVLAHGGPARGYSLFIEQGFPKFAVREDSKLTVASGKKKITGDWAHLAGTLTAEKELRLFVDGELAATARAPALISSNPLQSLEIGADAGSSVGDYRAPFGFTGTIDEVRVYHGVLGGEEIADRSENLGRRPAKDAELVLACSFDAADAKDSSGKGNHGTVAGAVDAKGKLGNALRFTATRRGGGRAGGSFVVRDWTQDLPLFVRAIALADSTLFIAGPPDLIDEEESFARLTSGDAEVLEQLAAQDAALKGARGGLLWAVDAASGHRLSELPLNALPVWDGMAAAHGALFISCEDGAVRSYR